MDRMTELLIAWQVPGETNDEYAMRKALRVRVLRHPHHRRELALIQEYRDMTRYNVLSTACWGLSTEGEVQWAGDGATA